MSEWVSERESEKASDLMCEYERKRRKVRKNVYEFMRLCMYVFMNACISE